jgi:hypothetical protein
MLEHEVRERATKQDIERFLALRNIHAEEQKKAEQKAHRKRRRH